LKKTVNIISRASTLAKIQAKMVGNAISQQHPQISLNYISTKTSGDVNQNLDISKSPSEPATAFPARKKNKIIIFINLVICC